ncbi:MAG: MBOAT family protein [Oscillospiraceae bacterium]|nr:MBOAT family protein [Oscillospiraceae bacterium]
MTFTSYCSIAYLGIFLPIVVVIYSIFPKKLRWLVLLISSYIFFWAISGKLIIYLLFTTLSVYSVGLWISALQKKRASLLKESEKEEKKAIKAKYLKKLRFTVAVAIVTNISILAVLKYSSFFVGNINDIFTLLKIPISLAIPKFAAPIGISFYTLQAASYVFDVYNEKIHADKNIGRFALYMAFFPQIMEGPICRYSDTAISLWSGEKIHFQNLKFGIQRILFGMMKKIVVADRLNIFVQNVFTDYTKYDGGIIAAAAVLYTCQLYMEFSGTMDIVIGIGEIFGTKITENFRRPFFSKTISEFWQRWHITLGAWFKDYIFYPVSMSNPIRKLTGKARKKLGVYYGHLTAGAIALFCVWLCNGLWHGAGWNYIFFGMYHFTLILCGNLITPLVNKTNNKLHIDHSFAPYKIMQIVRTTIFVCIGELFFRAEGLKAGLSMFEIIVTNFSLKSFTNGTILELGMDGFDFLITAITVSIVFAISILTERGISPRQWISERKLVIRWLFYYALIMYIVIFGAYGTGYVPVDPIYADF